MTLTFFEWSVWSGNQKHKYFWLVFVLVKYKDASLLNSKTLKVVKKTEISYNFVQIGLKMCKNWKLASLLVPTLHSLFTCCSKPWESHHWRHFWIHTMVVIMIVDFTFSISPLFSSVSFLFLLLIKKLHKVKSTKLA